MSASEIAAAGGGVLTWTFLEYVIHRWLGHHRRFGHNPFGIEHRRHHVEGDYFAPTWKKLVIAACVAAVLALALVPIAGAAPGLAYVGGLVGCYAVYEWLHRREHTHAGIGAYGRWARRHHFHHHFVDGRINHGVTTPLWDLVFGTYRRPGVIEVPPRLCMVWLVDPATGGIRAEHADRYRLGKQTRARSGRDTAPTA